jgi:hypothetical protein
MLLRTAHQAIRSAAFAAVVAMLFLAGCAGPGREQIVLKPRPSTHGLFLPYPTRMPEYRADTSVTHAELIRSIRFIARVDERGRVDSLAPVRKQDSVILRFYRGYFSSLRFEPGVRDTLKTPMRIPVVMYVGALGSRPVLVLPVEADRGVVNSDLYQEALGLNGIQAPVLKVFPSYSCTMLDSYKSTPYAMALLRVSLDAGGTPTEVTPVLSTCGGYVDQLRSACLWAKYEPAKVDGRAAPFTVYVLVSFLPDEGCPTPPLRADESALWSLKDRLRVRLYADTIGLASPPLPQRAWSGVIPRSDVGDIGPGRMSVLFEVDSLGQGNAQMISPLPSDFRASNKASWACRRVITTLCRFYPAFDFRGHQQPFSGLMHIQLEGEDSIRIWIDWLSDGRFLSVN